LSTEKATYFLACKSEKMVVEGMTKGEHDVAYNTDCDNYSINERITLTCRYRRKISQICQRENNPDLSLSAKDFTDLLTGAQPPPEGQKNRQIPRQGCIALGGDGVGSQGGLPTSGEATPQPCEDTVFRRLNPALPESIARCQEGYG